MEKSEAIQFILSLGTDKELETLGGKESFKELIEKTYEEYEPIFIDDEEIKEYGRREVVKYKQILEPFNGYLIKNAFIDRLRYRFFYKAKHKTGSDKLIKALETKEYKVSEENKLLVQETLKRLDAEQIKRLELKVNEKLYSLEEQLLARWSFKLYRYEDDFQNLFQYFEKGNAWILKTLKDIQNSIDLNDFLGMAETEYFMHIGKAGLEQSHVEILRSFSKLNPYRKTYIGKQYRLYFHIGFILFYLSLIIGYLLIVKALKP